MLEHDERYFYLGGVISLSFFSLILFLFMMVMLQKHEITVFAMKKDNYISVSLNTDIAVPSKNDVKPTLEPTPEAKPEAAPEPEPEIVSEPVETDVASLFDDVWTQQTDTKIVEKKEPVDTKRLSAIEKRIEVKEHAKSAQAQEALKEISLTKTSQEASGASVSTAPEVNEYLAKIHLLVKSKFFPPASSEGETAKVRVTLDANGKLLRYKVLIYSTSTVFNQEVDRLESRLKRLSFSQNPDGKSISLDIILRVEE